jgi:hypothetical protein
MNIGERKKRAWRSAREVEQKRTAEREETALQAAFSEACTRTFSTTNTAEE